MIDPALQTRIDAFKAERNPLTQAKMVAEIRETSDITSRKLAELLGVKASHISHLMRVLKLPDIIIDGFLSKQISFTHLVIVSRLKTHDAQTELYEEILSRTMSIAQTEQRVRELLYQVNSDGAYVSQDHMADYAERISKSLHGAKVQVIQTRIKCKIIIEQAGNLEKTTEFIEDTASRFRRKSKATQSTSPDADFEVLPLHGNLRKAAEPLQEQSREVLPEPLELPEPPPLETSSIDAPSPWSKLAYEKYTLSNATPIDVEEIVVDESDEIPLR